MNTSSSDPTVGLRDEFLISPDVVFLNHGSFGACPREVFEAYQGWQLELERQPVEFLSRRYLDLMRSARAALAAYVGTDTDNVVYVPNVTTATNIVARSLPLEPGDNVVGTDHEYGACARAWRFTCLKRGADYRQAAVSVPPSSKLSVADEILAQVDLRTKALFVSHITSITALQFPVEEICRRARQLGVLCIVDGAHAPGQIDLDLERMGVDIYIGNCHKWLCSPKGAAFLYARPAVQEVLEPLVVSWGWESERPGTSRFVDLLEYTGTRDIASYLAVPAAIQFQADRNWSAVRDRCHERLQGARRRLLELDGISPIHEDERQWYNQMESVAIPKAVPEELMGRLYDRHRIEAVVESWHDMTLLRACIQGYNTDSDVDSLIEAVALWLDERSRTGAGG